MTRPNWLYWNKAIDVSKILQIAEKEITSDATTFDNENPTHYRRSKIAWLTGNEEIMQILWPYVTAAADQFIVDVEAVSDFQYTEYHGTQKGKYDWHHDINWGDTGGRDRKLSVTLQLSDTNEYEGGNFEFAEVENPKSDCRDKGTILIFPSYLQHRVAPVTSGVRKTLVAWFEGPKWR